MPERAQKNAGNFLAVVALLAAHCGTPGGASPDARVDSATDTRGDARTPGPDVTDAGTASMCYADFPCFGQHYQCATATSYYNVVDHDCHYLCGPGPCSGGT